MKTRLVSFDGAESVDAEVTRPDRYRHLFDSLSQTAKVIPRGSGLSYCLASGGSEVRSVLSQRFNRILAFDGQHGRIEVEPGITQGELFRFTTPRGWICPVLAGHPSITIGGCVAANVHGKNPARDGLFHSHVERLTVFHPDHGEEECSPRENQGLFNLTVGGYGLTGFITKVRLHLRRVQGNAVRVTTAPIADLMEAAERLDRYEDVDTVYSWHDFNTRRRFGRGFVFTGEPASGQDKEARFPPLDARRGGWPVSFLRPLTVPMMSRVFGFMQAMRRREEILPLPAASFPIAGKEVYFRVFGPKGLREYQCIIPRDRWAEAVRRVERIVDQHRVPIGLASLKRFAGSPRYLGFDGDGVCLAIDVAATPSALGLFADLDTLTLDVGGVANLSKDSRLSATVARAMFPQYNLFAGDLAHRDPVRRFDSALRQRLEISR